MATEKKYTQEEIKAIVNEEIRKANLRSGRELDLNEMENISGGVKIPSTHEEIDQCWDAVQEAYDHYGFDVASILARELGLKDHDGLGFARCKIHRLDIPAMRSRMHRMLDGENADEIR